MGNDVLNGTDPSGLRYWFENGINITPGGDAYYDARDHESPGERRWMRPSDADMQAKAEAYNARSTMSPRTLHPVDEAIVGFATHWLENWTIKAPLARVAEHPMGVSSNGLPGVFYDVVTEAGNASRREGTWFLWELFVSSNPVVIQPAEEMLRGRDRTTGERLDDLGYAGKSAHIIGSLSSVSALGMQGRAATLQNPRTASSRFERIEIVEPLKVERGKLLAVPADVAEIQLAVRQQRATRLPLQTSRGNATLSRSETVAPKTGVSGGAAHHLDEVFAHNRHFSAQDTALKHGTRGRTVGGRQVSRGPTRGQHALDHSEQISPNSPRRIGISELSAAHWN